MELRKQTIVGIFLFSFLSIIAVAFLVNAEDYYSNDELTIQEFLVLDNSTLSNFDIEFLEVQRVMTDDVYYFKINLYLDYFNGESVLITPARVEHTFECNINLDCPTEYANFIDDYKDWWLLYYDDLKGDYNEL